MIAELRETNAEFADFLESKSSTPILQIDDRQVINGCNNGFLKLFNLSKKPIGAGLVDYLLPDSKDDIFEKKSQEFVCNPRTGVHGILIAYRMRYIWGWLLWLERPFVTNNQIVEQMSLLNNEYIAMQRELLKKNHEITKVQLELQEKVVQLESALSRVKLLEGIIPVCMYCKKIRDDAGTEPGKGRWMRMEEFLQQKSGTSVSHGICWECYEIHKDDD